MSSRHIVGFVFTLLLVGVLVVPRGLHFLSVREAQQLLERDLPIIYSPFTTYSGELLGEVNVPVPYSPFSTFRSSDDLPEEINLPVPFTPQAPHANWELPYQEACEEAAVLMSIR